MLQLEQYSINICPLNSCNMKCSFCVFVKDHKPVISAEKIDFAAIKDFLRKDEIAALPINRIFLSGMGETLLYPDIIELTQHVCTFGIQVLFFTNGVLLKPDISWKLLSAGVTDFCISATGLSGNVWKKMQGYGKTSETANKLVKVIHENVESLCHNRDLINPDAIVTMNYILTQETQSEVFTYVDYMRSIGVDYVTLVPFSNLKVKEEPKKTLQERISCNRRNGKCLCRSIGLNMMIDYNGNMYSCCTFVKEDLIIGNIYKDTLTEIMNGSKLQGILEPLLTGRGALPSTCEYCLTHIDYVSSEEGWL